MLRTSFLTLKIKSGQKFQLSFVGVIFYCHKFLILECFLAISYAVCTFFFPKGTHLSNTRDAKAFALLSEEGIAKGIRRVTAVTTDSALKAMELSCLLEQEVDDVSKTDGSLLEKVVF